MPHTNWSVKGIWLLVSSVGNHLKLAPATCDNTERLKPVRAATIWVEMSVMSSRPSLILDSLDGASNSLARVQVLYLTDIEACMACHCLFHEAAGCELLSPICNTDKFLEKMDVNGGELLGQVPLIVMMMVFY